MESGIRLRGVRVRNQTSARIDAILREKETDNSWWALERQSARVEIGDRLRFGDASESHVCLLDFLDADIVAKQDEEILLSFHLTGAVLDDALERLSLASS